MKEKKINKNITFAEISSVAIFIAALITIFAFLFKSPTKTTMLLFTPNPDAKYSYAPNTTCNTSNVSKRSDAYRCYDNNQIYDPCFLAQNNFKKNDLSCPTFFARAQENIAVPNLKRNVISVDGQKIDDSIPWLLETDDGYSCMRHSGAVNIFADEGVVYSCQQQDPVGNLNGVALSNVDRSTPLWTVQFGKSPDGPFSPKNVVKAWE